MPDNPMVGQAGNITRLKQMLHYLNESHAVEAEFVSLIDWGFWKEEHLEAFKIKYPNIALHLLEKKHKKNFFKYFVLYKIPYFFKSNSIDLSSYILRKEFQKILDSKKYDKILVSYAAWGKIIGEKDESTYTIIDTHDFLTAQNSHKKDIGKSFQDEIEILNNFDEVWTYSVEEEYIFGQFTRPEIKTTLIPVSFPLNISENAAEVKFDVIYVASDNPHNIAGIKWFLKEVLPLLKDIKIHIVGKIGTVIGDYENVVKYGMVDDLDDFYRQSKIAICPMLSGTGIKIKVVEALSYGIPVVTNRRGVDGLVNKKDNGCLVTDDAKVFAEEMRCLLKDEAFYLETREKAVSYFKENHDPQLEIKILNRTFTT